MSDRAAPEPVAGLAFKAAFHLAHLVVHEIAVAGWQLRRRRWLVRAALLAWWHRSTLECDVADDLRLGRDVRLTVTGRTANVVRIGAGCQIGDGVRIELRGGELVLGDGVDIRHGCVLGVSGRLAFEGPNVLQHGVTVHCDEAVIVCHHAAIGEYVTLVDSTHRTGERSEWFVHDLRTAPLVIGAHVWVAAKATITRGVHVGESAVVGAGSVVVHDVSPGYLASGVPAVERRPPHSERDSTPRVDPGRVGTGSDGWQPAAVE